MTTPGRATLTRLVAASLGESAAEDILATLMLHPDLAAQTGDRVSRSVFAMALTTVLFKGLLSRAPTAAAYVADVRAAGARVVFDHGALRTIRFGKGATGALPPGEEAFTRIFLALGYELAGLYPLDRLGMTGRAYAHRDLPEAIPQFFLSELHVERFSETFQAAAHRVFDGSRDPLDEVTLAALDVLRRDGEVSLAQAAAALPVIASSFARLHPEPAREDYETLLSESSEAAWIATEGSAFNHATDRVADVEGLAATQRALGRPIKPAVEISRSGRVRQTAFKADPVVRRFRTPKNGWVELTVPGSFYEFISRDPDPDFSGDRLDLRFDSGNAQGIFKMTAKA